MTYIYMSGNKKHICYCIHVLAVADPGFQVRGGGHTLKNCAQRRQAQVFFFCISCEKSPFYAKKSYFFQF